MSNPTGRNEAACTKRGAAPQIQEEETMYATGDTLSHKEVEDILSAMGYVPKTVAYQNAWATYFQLAEGMPHRYIELGACPKCEEGDPKHFDVV